MDQSFAIFKRPTLVTMLFVANIGNHCNNNFELFDAKIHNNGQISCLWAEKGSRCVNVAFLTAAQELKLRRLEAI